MRDNPYTLQRNSQDGVPSAARDDSSPRDRIAPSADGQQQDSQAVYLGTQFRF